MALRNLPCAMLLGLVLGVSAPAARAETLSLSPEKTEIRFELDSTLHTVHGTARLVSGEIDFAPEGGSAGGRLVVDARSLETGNGMRDDTMHSKVLESERYPQIELLPETLEVGGHEGSVWHVVLGGVTHIHGGTWPLSIRADVTMDGDDARIHGSFVIPHVAWGMRDMSNFLLDVEKETHVEFDATGRIAPAHAAAPASHDGPTRPVGAPG